MSARVVHFLLHVPKCAGTTVELHFERALGAGFLRAPRWESPWRNIVGNRYPFGPGDERLAPVKVVSGHSLSEGLARCFPGAEIREYVLLRDPVGYHLSFYNYRWARHRAGLEPEPPRFGLWYRTQRRNPISRFLLNRYFEQGVPALYRLSSAGRLAFLEARLARFRFVGGHGQVRDLVAGVSREIGIEDAVTDENVTRERRETRESLGEDWIARIEDENALDAALYQRWARRGWTTQAVVRSGGARDGASSPVSRAPIAGGDGRDRAPRSSPIPRLGRWDHVRYLGGDLVSGLAKKLLR